MEKIVCKLVRGNYRKIFAKIKGGKVVVYANTKTPRKEIDDFLQKKKKDIAKVVERQKQKVSKANELEKQGKAYLFGREVLLPQKHKDRLKNVREFCKEYQPNLRSILFELANKSKLKCDELVFGNAKTLWGTCYHVGYRYDKIRLNERLIMLPRDLIEYVCMHELTHTVHHNHSKDFWNELKRHMPDALERRKKLRNEYGWVLEFYR